MGDIGEKCGGMGGVRRVRCPQLAGGVHRTGAVIRGEFRIGGRLRRDAVSGVRLAMGGALHPVISL